MRKVLLNGSEDITPISGELTIKGSTSQVSRTLDFDVIRPGADKNLPSVSVNLGSTITVEDNGLSVFKGVTWFRDFDDNVITQRLTCYDMVLYTSKSDVEDAVFKDMSCKDIASKVLGELGLPVGELEEGIVLTYNGRNKTAYEIIMDVYKEAHKKTKKKYHMVVKGDKICVVEMKDLSPVVIKYREVEKPGTILHVSFEESIDNMVNKVKVINEKKEDEKKDEDENRADIEAFGLVQKIIKGEKEDTKGVLQSAKTDINVECFGDWSLVSGSSVKIETKHVSGQFYIVEDTHTVKDNLHICVLKLSKEIEMQGGGE